MMKLAFVGCGAVTEISHLPACAVLGVRPHAFVDRDLQRAERLARRWDVPIALTAIDQLPDAIDAAVVAVPPAFHRGVTVALLQRGIHVLVEKPLAVTVDEGEDMVRTAAENGVSLSIGLMRRWMAAARWVQSVMASGVLGTIAEFSFEEGGRYGWPITTASAFRRELAGGGVLVDTGAHTLDLLWWWLGAGRVTAYCDDSFGGVEADCEAEIELESGGRGTVTLSRTRTLSNEARISGHHGTITASLIDNRVTLDPPTLVRQVHHGFRADRLPQQSVHDLFVAQLEAWLRTVSGRGNGAVPGSEGLATLRTIAACYERRQPLELPWMSRAIPAGEGPC